MFLKGGLPWCELWETGCKYIHNFLFLFFYCFCFWGSHLSVNIAYWDMIMDLMEKTCTMVWTPTITWMKYKTVLGTFLLLGFKLTSVMILNGSLPWCELQLYWEAWCKYTTVFVLFLLLGFTPPGHTETYQWSYGKQILPTLYILATLLQKNTLFFCCILSPHNGDVWSLFCKFKTFFFLLLCFWGSNLPDIIAYCDTVMILCKATMEMNFKRLWWSDVNIACFVQFLLLGFKPPWQIAYYQFWTCSWKF